MTEHSSAAVDDEVLDIGHYFRALRSHKKALVIGLLLGLLAGLLVAQLRGSTYTSQAEVVVQAVSASDSANGLNSAANVNIATEREIAASPATAELARVKLTTALSASDLLAGLTVTVPAKSNVLTFQYTAGDATTAQRSAQAFADAYLDLRREQGNELVDRLVAGTESRIADVQEELDEIRGEVAAADEGSAARRAAQLRQRVLIQQMAALQNNIAQFAQFVVDPGIVLESASVPSSDAGTKGLVAASFALLGLLLAGLYAILRTRVDRRVHNAADIERTIRVPVVASLSGNVSTDPGLDVLAARLAVASHRDGQRIVMVTSADHGRASETLATALGYAVARRGIRAAVISSGDALRLGAESGVIGARTPHAAQASLLHLERDGDVVTAASVRRTLDAARRTAELVIVVTPSATTSAEALLVAAEADSVLVVAVAGATGTDELSETAQTLAEIGARVTGVVVTTGGEQRRRSERSDRRTTTATAPADATPALADRRDVVATGARGQQQGSTMGYQSTPSGTTAEQHSGAVPLAKPGQPARR